MKENLLLTVILYTHLNIIHYSMKIIQSEYK